ncbi:MAG TPA: nucleoside deaminase [Xanthobacteraceae bacterium]|nr:nucleoside deaminase [Xanthobacteraceae bacterium]
MEFSDLDRTMMARCIELARSGAAEGEHPFGSVIANGAAVVAEASNRTVRDRDESRHAEILAIAQARQVLGDSALPRCTLYSIIEPCAMCSFCIRAAGIRRVVFALHSPVLGGMSKWNILGDRALSRRIPCLFRGPPDVAHGVLADEAMQAWSDWRPLATQAIRLLGFFVKAKAGKIDADGL